MTTELVVITRSTNEWRHLAAMIPSVMPTTTWMARATTARRSEFGATSARMSITGRRCLKSVPRWPVARLARKSTYRTSRGLSRPNVEFSSALVAGVCMRTPMVLNGSPSSVSPIRAMKIVANSTNIMRATLRTRNFAISPPS